MTATGMDLSGAEQLVRRIGWTRRQIVLVACVFLAIFHVVAGIWGLPNILAYRHVHLELMMLIVVTAKPMSKKRPLLSAAVDSVMAVFLLGTLLYVLDDLVAFAMREGDPTDLDTVIGTIFILVLLEASRRVTGWVIGLIAVFFFMQNLFADVMPGIFEGPRVLFVTMVDFTFMRSTGIFGAPLQTISTFVVLFMVFAALLNESGAGAFFINLATAVTGKSRGGPAKAAVVASAGLGTISGSAIANVAGSGVITIPLMKKIGFAPTYAGAVEAVASTGGQIMPPIMGATAFLIAQNLGMPYIDIALFATIPAVLYFAAVFFMVDFHAGKTGMKGMATHLLPKAGETLRSGGHLLLPIVVVVGLLAIGRSAQFSSMVAIVALIAVSFMRKWTRLDGFRTLRGMSDGIMETAGISVTAAAAGIIIGGVSISGLNLMFAYEILRYSEGHLWLALIMVAIASLILGMGMTTSAVYITVATIMAPALINLGVVPLAAHMYCFFFGIIAVITPPVALASFTAAGISGASPSDTGWVAFRLGIAAYIIPFIFVYDPALLMQGTIFQIIHVTVTSFVGCWALASAAEGFLITRSNPFERLLMAGAALCALIPEWTSDMAGIAVILGCYCMQRRRVRRLALNPAQTTESERSAI